MSNTNENNKPHELSPADQAAVEPLFGAGLLTPPDLLPMAAALTAASPAPPRIDRDRLMFLAGAASAMVPPEPRTPGTPWVPAPLTPAKGSGFRVHEGYAWPAATAALAATSLALATALFLRPAPPERIVYLPQPVESGNGASASGGRQPPEAILVASQNTPAQVRVVAPATAHQHNYLRSRDVALRFGLDALGTLNSASGEGAPAPTYRTLLESLGLPRLPAEASDSQQM